MRPALLELPELAETRPISLLQRATRYARRVPGQLTILLTALVLLCMATGLAGVLDIQHRQAVLAGIAERSGPLTVAAEEIYQSISDADATAAGAFLVVGGIETKELRDSYQGNIRDAAAALTTAAAGAPSGNSAAVVAELSTYLPIYTGLIETARTLNRQGLPQGGAYLREASALAQRTMLPLAQQLFTAETTGLATARDESGQHTWIVFAVGTLALACLVAAQIYLARNTRRILNAGLLVAAIATLAALTWFGVASASAASHTSASHDNGTAQVEAIAAARIAALQARSDEALTLVARGGGADYEKHFVDTSNKLNGNDGLLARAKAAVAGSDTGRKIESAIAAWGVWSSGHQQVRMLDDGGGYADAVLLATTDPKGTAAPSRKVDAELGQAITDATSRFNDEASRARSAVSTADLAVSILMVLAAIAVAFGFAPRLQEFR